MNADAPVQEAMRAVASFMVADAPVSETLHRIAVLARDALPSVAAGITLLDQRDKPSTSVFTDDLAPDMDRAQYEEGSGPCLQAFRENRVVRVDDVEETAARWPKFAERAEAYEIASTLSVPLSASGGAVGALNLYADKPQAYSASDEEAAREFGFQAAIVVSNALSYWRVFELSEGLKQAVETREIIGLAKGLIMASSQCSPDEAFQILVRASQRENVKLRDIAARIVESRDGRTA